MESRPAPAPIGSRRLLLILILAVVVVVVAYYFRMHWRTNSLPTLVGASHVIDGDTTEIYNSDAPDALRISR
jgi:hypothetical protein